MVREMALRILEVHEMTGILALFLIVQFGGIAIAMLTIATGNAGVIVGRLVSQQSVVLSYAIDAVLVGVILMLLLNRYRRHNNDLWDHDFFLVFEAAVLVATCFFAFLFVFTSILPQGFQNYYFALSIAAALLIVFARERVRAMKNVATVISSIGVGLVLGIYFNFAYTLLILAVVALYDYAAVFITKAMIRLAGKLSEEDVAFLISEEDVEAIPIESLSRGEVKKYLNSMSNRFDYRDPLFMGAVLKGSLPVISQIQLGEGDLGLPLMAAVSMLFTFSSAFASEFIIAFAAVGLVVTMFFLKRYRRPLPAIPPLFSFISAGSGIALFLIGSVTFPEMLVFILIGIVMISFGTYSGIVKSKHGGDQVVKETYLKTSKETVLRRRIKMHSGAGVGFHSNA